MRRAHRDALSLPDLLTYAARSHPHRTALTDGARVLDYRALDTVADHVGAALNAEGVGRGDRVAVLGARDARVCALLYGVLRSGAAAVLADPDWSGADLRRRLDAVAVGRALTPDPALRAPGARPTDVVDVDAAAATAPARVPGGNPAAPELAGEPAYLSFTSGSSGEPKAVSVSHANAVHYAGSLRSRLGYGDSDAPCVGHVTTFAADLGHTAWLLALATGGSVHVVPDQVTRDPQAFWAALRRAGVSVLKTTPSHMAALLDGRPQDGPVLDTLLLGGEALPRSLAAALLAGGGAARRVVNHYGPTEATIGATCFLASSGTDLPEDEPTVPVGTALGDVRLHLVDADGRPVRDGAQGELLIAGSGVTGGYVGRPEETARRFVDHGGERAYRTGDVCRRRPGGDLVFVGRTDRETKIRGFRVDPVEVERVMEEFPAVGRAAVIVRETPAGRQLMAVVSTRNRHHGPVRSGDGSHAAHGDGSAALRAHLRDRLPEYAVPHPILALPSLPTGPNGKLDRERLTAIVDETVERRARRSDTGPAEAHGGARRPVAEAIARLWAGALGLPSVDPHADVRALGGDSILAMRTIAFLRRCGHRVTFDDFYQHPTPALLAAAVRDGKDDTAPPPAAPAGADGRSVRLAPAQRWLLRQRLDDPRHWNQSVLLRCGTAVDGAALAAAVRDLLRRHPALRRPVGPFGAGEPRPEEDVDAVSFSRLPVRPELVAQTVDGLCTELHRSLDPASGRLLRAHLFTAPAGVGDRLAVIVHHLAVDGLSWRILLEDLAHAYRAALQGQSTAAGPRADFYAWARAAAPEPPGAVPSALPPPPPDRATRAGTAPTALTWALGEDVTARLVARHGRSQRLEALLLSALADAVPDRIAGPRLDVEVETHGRDTSGAGAVYTDTVGWFTAVRRVSVDRPGPDTGSAPDAEHDADTPKRSPNATAPDDRIGEVARLVRAAPELPMDTGGVRPVIGFNFLGTFQLPDCPELDWSVAREQAGTARCPSGDPLYLARLTARIVEGRLVTDLVYACPGLSHQEAADVMGDFGRTVAAGAGAAPPPHTRSPVSTSGHLLHTGHVRADEGDAAAPPAARIRTLREPTRVLLTGSTGFVGRHLLSAFAARGAHVTCLVRGERDVDAARHPDLPRGGVDVVSGDINREGLGLGEAGLARARGVHLVVHAAADVRLVAPPAELERTNHDAVRRLLSWIDAETEGARLHHVSTLAVCGAVEGPSRRFSEADLRIGQTFRTPYERAKFAAEETVRSWIASGRQGYVHRSGHVAAHSRTGAFQDNVADNRVYQLVRGYVMAGAAPRRPSVTFAFSHVDTVAAGIAEIATHPHAAPGTYHVESPHEVPHDLLVEWIARHGHPVELTDDRAFAAALAEAGRHHPTEAGLASAWTQMEERNVEIDSSYTVSVLDRLGVRFTAPTPGWWSTALEWATAEGFLPPTAVSEGVF